MTPLRELFLTFFVIKLCLTQNLLLNNNCKSKETCSECIQELGCVWCIQPLKEPKSHCIHELEAHSQWCSKQHIRNPTWNNQSFVILEDRELTSDKDAPVQIRPQRVKLTLRKGQEYNLSFHYGQARNYPVDLYYIMDLSASMKSHKEALSRLGADLVRELQKITNNVRLGFGSFVDKVALPFVSTVKSKLEHPCSGCFRPYSFKNHMSLSNQYEKFQTEVKNAKISGNLDAPEGGFDALMQAIVCKDVIGWRDQARHLLVFSTDAEFHIAGDGKLAGVVEPNDAKCHMENNSYTHDLILDYPSVSHINYQARENNINIIFAIVDRRTRTMNSYTGLSKQIDNSNVGGLNAKSDNVVKLVEENYKKITNSVKISTNSTSDVDVKISSNNCSFPTENGCSKINVNDIVSFNAIIKPIECSKGSNKKIISIKPEGLNESVIVELEVICDCDCEHEGSEFYKTKAQACNSDGTLKCGICDCKPGYFGQKCECNREHSTTNDISACKADKNDTKVCSGSGVCICGQCRCDERPNPNEKIFGKFCDCDNYSCKKAGGKLCSGRGECTCGSKCRCMSGWSGDDCNCPDSDSTCRKPENPDLICNGHGTCNCGKCKCNSSEEVRYSGKYCDECPTCQGQRCDELKNCVECKAYNDGEYNKEQCKANCTSHFKIVEKIEEDQDENIKRCTLVDSQGCTFVFTYENIDKDQNELKVTAEKNKFCPAPPNILAWVLGVIGTIFLAGLILLIIWKVCTTIYDRREYAKFENETQKSRWHNNDNPLYKQATSTFNNPVYRKSRN